MKRYNSTPNRLSYISGNISPSKRYTNNYFPILSILAIALIIILVVYKSCYNTTHQQTKPENNVTTDKLITENNTNLKKASRNKLKIPSDIIPRDSLPPETNLKILTDEH